MGKAKVDINKIINGFCNFMNKKIEETSCRIEEIQEEKRQELRGYSDEKIKKIYQNRDQLGSTLRDLVEEEVKRRKLRIR